MYLKYFIASTVGLFFGIFFAYSFDFSTQIFLVSFVISILNFLIYKFSKRRFGVYKNETPIFLSLFFLFISLGILFAQFSISKDLSQREKFSEFISQKENFIGTVYKIKETEKSQQLFIKLEEKDSENIKDNFQIKVITGKFPKYLIGQKLSLFGKISFGKTVLPTVENSDEINKSFDSSRSLSLADIDGEMVFPKVESLVSESQSKFESFLFSFQNLKNKFVNILDEVSPREVSSLSSGTTLGDDSLFSKEEVNNFRTAGISHIIVLSGFNITILIYFLGFIFLNLHIGLKKRIFLTIFSIIIFVFFVGSGASIVRAAIMGSVLLLANISGRQYVAKQALFLSAFIMMILNPKIVLSDISFHLSFLATFAILYLMPIFDQYKIFQKENYKNKFIQNILEIFKITFAIQIFVLPYIAFTFGKVSLFGIFANILVVPFVPIIMFFALLIIFFYFIFSPISIFLSYISFVFCKYIFLVSDFISSISFSSIEISLSFFSVLVIYSLFIFLLFFEEKRLRVKRYLKNI